MLRTYRGLIARFDGVACCRTLGARVLMVEDGVSLMAAAGGCWLYGWGGGGVKGTFTKRWAR